MASETTIKKQIENSCGGKYSDWQIGLTHDPAHRKAQMGNPLSWLQWKADTEETARNVLQHFLNKGMQSAGSIPESPEYVYIVLTHSQNNNFTI